MKCWRRSDTFCAERGGKRAPHKPLLVLYALGRWSRGEATDFHFAEIATPLTDLLKQFGPPRQSYHPEYPFRHLQNDGVWMVRAALEAGRRCSR